METFTNLAAVVPCQSPRAATWRCPGGQPAAYSMDELIHPLATSLKLIKGFTSLHKPCFTTTLNPHLATHIPNNQTYFREREKTVTYWTRAVSLAEKYILAGAEKRHLCPACQEDRPAGTHRSIPLRVQGYFAVPLIVLPKHLISIASLTLPDALWDVFRVIKIGKHRQTPTRYKFSNMNWRRTTIFNVPAVTSTQH